MICLRCGYCCVHLDVAILNPKSIKSDGSIYLECPDPIIVENRLDETNRFSPE